MKSSSFNLNFIVIFLWPPFNQNSKHIQINIENEISMITFDQSWQVYIFSMNVMFMTLTRFNKII